MSRKDERHESLLRFIRRRSGRRFTVAVLAREFGVSERTIQDDLLKYPGKSSGRRATIPCTDKTEISSSTPAVVSDNLINQITGKITGLCFI